MKEMFIPSLVPGLVLPNTQMTGPLTKKETRMVLDSLDNEELAAMTNQFGAYRPGFRYAQEFSQISAPFISKLYERDEIGRTMLSESEISRVVRPERLAIVIRHYLKKKWLLLGVWNPTWGFWNPRSRSTWLPGWDVSARPSETECANTWLWPWETAPQPEKHLKEDYWPTRTEETPDQRAIRHMLEKRGQWDARFDHLSDRGQLITEAEMEAGEKWITSRPWYRFELEVHELACRLFRIDRDMDAAKMIKAQWMTAERWNADWVHSPGWYWPDEEQPWSDLEDSNGHGCTPSEIDALEAISTPPPASPGIVHEPTFVSADDFIRGNYMLDKESGRMLPLNGARHGDEHDGVSAHATDDASATNEELPGERVSIAQDENRVLIGPGIVSSTSTPKRGIERLRSSQVELNSSQSSGELLLPDGSPSQMFSAQQRNQFKSCTRASTMPTVRGTSPNTELRRSARIQASTGKNSSTEHDGSSNLNPPKAGPAPTKPSKSTG